MSGHPSSRGGPRGRGGSGDRGGPSRGRGDRGGSDRGSRGAGRGAGDRGRGDPAFRGSGSMAIRGGYGGPSQVGGIYLPDEVPQPDQSITNAENALVQATRDQVIEGMPGRRGYGTKGKPIVLRTNYFTLTTAYEAKKADLETPFVLYTVSYSKEVSRKARRNLIEELMRDSMFSGHQWATDWSQWIILTKQLAQKEVEITVTPRSANQAGAQQGPAPGFVQEARARNTAKLRIAYKTTYNLCHMIEYLRSSVSGADYPGRTDIIAILNIIVCKAPNLMNNVVDAGRNRFYPHSVHPATEVFELGGGLQALRGYYASVRPAVNRLLVNLNVTSGAFYKPIPLMLLLRQAKEAGLVKAEQQEQFIRMLRVEVKYCKRGQQQAFMTKYKTIAGFARPHPPTGVDAPRYGNASRVRFRYTDRNTIPPQDHHDTVATYFQRQHGITLESPELPVLNCGTRGDPQYIPAELCTVIPGQPYRRLLGGTQTAEMIKFAARFPNLNAMSIAGNATAPGTGLRIFRLESDAAQQTSTQPFGFKVGTKMLTVPARQLAAPRVNYSQKGMNPSNGSWNCANQKFSRGGSFGKWSTLIINRQGKRALSENPQYDMLEPVALIGELANYLSAYGIRMGERVKQQTLSLPDFTRDNRSEIDKLLSTFLERAEKAGIVVLLVVLPEVDRWVYARLKYWGDVKYGVHTICSVGNKLQNPKGQGMYMGNLALKFNIKGKGVNHTVPNVLTKPLDNNTMLVGMDVTHPSPGSSEGAPSIASIVASVDEYLQQWPGSVRPQTGKKEMVEELKSMVIERLKLWHKKHNKYPSKIVVYRDGVSEGQYKLVLEQELPPFQEASRELYGDQPKWPKMAIIIVGKRHHTRFFPINVKDADYNEQRGKGNWNPLPGTVVDRHISGKVLREFWLQAHQALQGTARSAHYVVIKDDIKFEADELEQLTHNMCYLFGRATKAVSICPPAYYADLLCERGRAYLFNTLQENHGSDSSVFDGANEWSGGVHPRLAESTWYI